MRATKYLLFSAAAAVAVCGQGLVQFNNRTGREDAPVTLSNGTGPGDTMRAGLFLLRNGGFELIETTVFRTGSEPLPKFIVPKFMSVPGVAPGSPATLRMRVWPASSASYEE